MQWFKNRRVRDRMTSSSPATAATTASPSLSVQIPSLPPQAILPAARNVMASPRIASPLARATGPSYPILPGHVLTPPAMAPRLPSFGISPVPPHTASSSELFTNMMKLSQSLMMGSTPQPSALPPRYAPGMIVIAQQQQPQQQPLQKTATPVVQIPKRPSFVHHSSIASSTSSQGDDTPVLSQPEISDIPSGPVQPLTTNLRVVCLCLMDIISHGTDVCECVAARRGTH